MTRPRVLVLGGTSRIAGMMRRWHPGGADVIWGARQGRGPGGPDWVQVDTRTDPAALAAACAQVDVILDLSGPTNNPARAVAGFEAIPDLARAVAHAARGKPLLWMSSAAVYGPRRNAREDAPRTPVSAYGRAKLRAEDDLIGRPGVTVLRLGNVAGADALLGQARPGLSIRLDRFADGSTPYRSYIGPKTLAESLFFLIGQAASGQVLPPVLNLSAPGPGVEMAALLKAARLGFTLQTAPPEAVSAITLDTAALAALLPLPDELGTAAAIVADWRADRARLREGRA
ncbi:NAD-dependent epimerase/dehydratase family protein [Tropicimonas sp. S265A]|uniref:NAD-dependent epimerase/dehydratase family protein n=1 Tax=Tropicimonas sp. S265A TaxID=3415134 RepID=UPI003C7D73E0